jgi:hypothetical protein
MLTLHWTHNWGIQPIQVNIWHDAKVTEEFQKQAAFLKSHCKYSSNTEHYFNLRNFGDSTQWYAQLTHTVLSGHGLYCQVKQVSRNKCQSLATVPSLLLRQSVSGKLPIFQAAEVATLLRRNERFPKKVSKRITGNILNPT